MQAVPAFRPHSAINGFCQLQIRLVTSAETGVLTAVRCGQTRCAACASLHLGRLRIIRRYTFQIRILLHITIRIFIKSSAAARTFSTVLSSLNMLAAKNKIRTFLMSASFPRTQYSNRGSIPSGFTIHHSHPLSFPALKHFAAEALAARANYLPAQFRAYPE